MSCCRPIPWHVGKSLSSGETRFDSVRAAVVRRSFDSGRLQARRCDCPTRTPFGSLMEGMPSTTEIDGRAMGRWLQTEYPGQQLEDLIEQVARECVEMGRTCRTGQPSA